MDFIYSGIGWLLSLFNSWTGNYIIALLFFAVFAKVILLPLDIKQQKNSIKQAKLRPKEMVIRNKYKGRTDRATQMKMQQEIQDLYQREGYSMFGGCLPMLIQFPIIIILYAVIRAPLTYICNIDTATIKSMAEILRDNFGAAAEIISGDNVDQIRVIAEIEKLSPESLAIFNQTFGEFTANLPNFNVFGVNLGFSPDQYRTAVAGGNFFNIMLLIPALNFIIQFASTKVMKLLQPQPVASDDPSQGCSMKFMEFTLPLMTVFFAYNMSAAIGVYWIFQNIISLIERFFISRAMPIPKYTEEEIKQIQKAMKKDPPANAARPERRDGEKPRSLHRIDEDDDDVPPPPVKKSESDSEKEDEKKAAPTKQEQKNAAIADKVIGEAPILKDESDKHNKKKKGIINAQVYNKFQFYCRTLFAFAKIFDII